MHQEISIRPLRCATRSIAVALAALAVVPSGTPQERDPLGGLNDEQKRAIAEPFKGITTNGELVSGLFALRATGISTAPVRSAAEAFLGGLSAEQRARAEFPVDDREWRMWVNTPAPARQGVSFEELSDAQRELALGLLRASLSTRGFEKTANIMKLNETFAELQTTPQRKALFGQWKYWLTIMGTPSASEPWGWQLDGHHGIVNYFVLGDQVVMTPTFLGSQPVRAESGKFKGTAVLREEQDKGLALFASLEPAQRAVAAIRNERGTVPSLAGAYRDNVVLDYAGIRAADLDARQRTLLLELIAEYVNNAPEGHARIRLAEVNEHIDDTYFAWAGTADPLGAFYYRVQSPVVLIEFDHQLTTLSDGSRVPNRDHVHTVIRTPNGNDYGKDLLRQHYAQHPHGGR